MNFSIGSGTLGSGGTDSALIRPEPRSVQGSLEVSFVKLSHTSRRIGAVLGTIAVAMTMTVSGTAAAGSGDKPKPHTPPPFAIRVMSVNDFHGNLQPPAGSSGRITLSDGKPPSTRAVPRTSPRSQGCEVRGARTRCWSAAGDIIGASPLASALFHDEPTIDFLNSLDLQASAVGNHEFDEGYAGLQRMQTGGCHPVDGCQFDDRPSAAPTSPTSAPTSTSRTACRPCCRSPIRRSAAVHDRHHRRDTEGPARRGHARGDRRPEVRRRGGGDQSHLEAADRLGIKVQIVVMHQGDNIGSRRRPERLPCPRRPRFGDRREATPRSTPSSPDTATRSTTACGPTRRATRARSSRAPPSAGCCRSSTCRSTRRPSDVVRSATHVAHRIVTRTVTPDPAPQASWTRRSPSRRRSPTGRSAPSPPTSPAPRRRLRRDRPGRRDRRRAARGHHGQRRRSRDHQPRRHPRRPDLRRSARARATAW